MDMVTVYPPVSQTIAEEVLRMFDTEFEPRLSERVNMQDYAKKLAHNAVWFLVYEQDVIVAHCAVYMNQPEDAFISSIAVKQEVRGKGIGGCLWACVEQEAVQRGMCRILLRVMKTNLSGIRFYKDHACSILEDGGGWFMMERRFS